MRPREITQPVPKTSTRVVCLKSPPIDLTTPRAGSIMDNRGIAMADKPLRDAKGHYIKGQCGNQSGRTVGSVSIMTVLKRKLRENPQLVEDIADQFIRIARRKNYKQLEAMKELFDRLDGRVVETHKVEIENPVVIQFVPAPLDNKGATV